MKELIFEAFMYIGVFCLAVLLSIGIIALITFIKDLIKQKIKEHQTRKAKALEKYVQYRINRYIHKGY